MPTNAIAFSTELGKLAAERPAADLVKLHRKLTLELSRRVVFRTPVDTGFARSNWQVGVGVTNESLLAAGRSYLDIQADAINVLASLPPFSVTYVFNNAPYIGFLEEGSSAQAPQGMLAVSVNEVEVLGAVL